MGKTTFVGLACKVGDTQVHQEFEFSHAQRILDLPRSAWFLDDPKFELKDGVITRRNKKGDK